MPTTTKTTYLHDIHQCVPAPESIRTIRIQDRNETKTLTAWGLVPLPSPRDACILDFEFEMTEALFEARRAYSCNHPVPCLSFIAASKFVDGMIHDHRCRGANHAQ